MRVESFRFLIAVVCGPWLVASRAEADLPSVDRVWSGADYARVAKELGPDDAPLPRLGDAKGRAFFARLTSAENLELCRSRELPVAARMAELPGLMTSCSTILKRYYAAMVAGQPVAGEVVRLMGFLLRIGEVSVGVSEEFIPTIPKDDDYETRMNGFKQMRSGLTTMFEGCMQSASAGPSGVPVEMSGLLEAMTATLPVLKRAFPESYLEELRTRIGTLKDAFPDKADRDRIARMRQALGP